ncbi:MAG: DUF177 domain-containing protein [Anaerolineales bacterium]|nr:DUF177 domain-containing protein [Anaerolineales bacterium]MCB8966408.1 DUF177 domain-containing protein [Ardenticatenaceae bacterium]
MGQKALSRLRFNFGFLLEATLGESRVTELDYPTIRVSEDVTLTPLQGQIEATRTSEGIYIAGVLHSAIELECVRCLTPFLHPITFEIGDLFYYPPHTAPPGEFVIAETGFVDLAPLVRELSLLEIPMHALCKEDCLGLCQECGQNLNEGDCGCEEDNSDPRFAILGKLLD